MKYVKIIEAPKNFRITNLDKNKYLVIKDSDCFIKIPKFFCLKYSEGNLTLETTTNIGSAESFAQKAQLNFNKVMFPFARRIIFRGLGLKFSIASKPEFEVLELKLGFSHVIRLIIPKPRIKLKAFKNALVAVSCNLVALKNFICKIKRLKMPNAYKGKGIWYKNEKKKLKPIKKS